MLACSTLAGAQLTASSGSRSVASSSGAARRGSGPLLVQAQQRKDPSADPNYRRGSQNDYWRKRTNTAKSTRGASVSVDNEKRRRGRSAHLRSPDDTPLRDGNRDRLMGMLTERAARTLEFSLEAAAEKQGGEASAADVAAAAAGNPELQRWVRLYLSENKIPKDGNWSDVSGENFLRTLLTKPVEEISGSFSEEDDSFMSASPVGGDPRALAQRIMDLRHDIAKEWIEELALVQDENKLLMNEVLMKSLESPAAAGSTGATASASSASGADGDGASGGEGAGAKGAEGAEGASTKPPRKVDIEALDDSAAGGDD